MSTNGNQLSPSANVLVEFVLQVDERCVGPGGEFDVSQDSAGKIWPNFAGLRLDVRYEHENIQSYERQGKQILSRGVARLPRVKLVCN